MLPEIQRLCEEAPPLIETAGTLLTLAVRVHRLLEVVAAEIAEESERIGVASGRCCQEPLRCSAGVAYFVSKRMRKARNPLISLKPWGTPGGT